MHETTDAKTTRTGLIDRTGRVRHAGSTTIRSSVTYFATARAAKEVVTSTKMERFFKPKLRSEFGGRINAPKSLKDLANPWLIFDGRLAERLILVNSYYYTHRSSKFGSKVLSKDAVNPSLEA